MTVAKAHQSGSSRKRGDPDLHFARNLLRWYGTNDRPLPWRQHWQKYRDPYAVWVSEIMLQQTTIAVVIAAYQRFMVTFPTVQDLARASEEDVRLACRGLGYYRRFSFLHRGAVHAVTHFSEKNGRISWPTTAEAWQTLPGIGLYTSAAIASICFDEPIAVVDGNVERVMARYSAAKLVAGSPKLKEHSRRHAMRLLDTQRPGDFNQAMMELGQLVCSPEAPRCGACPIETGCKARAQNIAGKIPLPKIKTAAVAVELNVLIATRGDRYALVRRSDDAKFLRGTLGFPLHFGKPKKQAAIGRFAHSITHHRLRASVYDEKAAALPNKVAITWTKKNEVEQQLLSNLDRKAWHLFIKRQAQKLAKPNL